MNTCSLPRSLSTGASLVFKEPDFRVPTTHALVPAMTANPAEAPIPLAQLLTVAISVLRQGIDLVDNVLTSDDQMVIHSKHVPGSTIGTFSVGQ
jgi:hypothetical protein